MRERWLGIFGHILSKLFICRRRSIGIEELQRMGQPKLLFVQPHQGTVLTRTLATTWLMLKSITLKGKLPGSTLFMIVGLSRPANFLSDTNRIALSRISHANYRTDHTNGQKIRALMVSFITKATLKVKYIRTYSPLSDQPLWHGELQLQRNDSPKQSSLIYLKAGWLWTVQRSQAYFWQAQEFCKVEKSTRCGCIHLQQFRKRLRWSLWSSCPSLMNSIPIDNEYKLSGPHPRNDCFYTPTRSKKTGPDFFSSPRQGADPKKRESLVKFHHEPKTGGRTEEECLQIVFFKYISEEKVRVAKFKLRPNI